MTEVKINPRFRDLIPPLGPEELAQLEANILADGCRDPLVTWDGYLVDGHNRLNICQKHGIAFKTTEIEFPSEASACVWIIDNQFGRRNLSILTRVELAEKRRLLIPNRQGDRTDLSTSLKNLSKVPTPTKQSAAIAGVSEPTYIAAKLVLDHADDKTKEEVRTNRKSVHAAAAEIKERKQRSKREAKRTEAAKSKPIDSRILVGDFRAHADKVADGSIALIFTDPPYDKEAEQMFPALARFAAAKLAEGGSVIMYAGHLQLPALFNSFSGQLRHWWTCACVHSGSKALMREYGIRVGWKPMVWFVKGTRHDKSAIVGDTVSGAVEKDWHDWQQAETEAAHWIEHLCPAGGIVCDPFLGGGTTAVAAKKLGREWVGFEINESTAEKAAARIND